MRFFILCVGLLLSPFLQAQVSINEILASNAISNADPQSGEYSDWIELYNAGSSPVSLDNWTLTDDADEPAKWGFPSGTSIAAGGFLLIWADGLNSGLHSNFKLSADGERVLLFDNQGVKLDSYVFGPQLTDVSIGRETDGNGAWGYFAKPSPGASNNNAVFYTNYVQTAPYFSVSGGFYASPVTLTIKNLSPESGKVRYTLDGSTPNETSPVFSGTISITANTVVKARISRVGQIPGPITTNTYFIGEDFASRGLAVLSLSGDPAHFWAQDSGLLSNHNFKPDWERPIHLEFYENDGVLGFHHDAGASVGGENSWVLPQKLLNVFSRKQYGGGKIEYQIFPGSSRKSYEDIILRTSGNDWSNTFFRDGMEQGLAASTADLDVQAFRPVATFVNGVYYGMYNLREKQDKDYLAFHHNIDPSNVDYIENNAEVKAGDAVAYQEMVSTLEAGVSSDAAFQQLDKIMDTQNYTDYIISEIFCGNFSWGHNIALFREKTPTARWRWLPHDYDRGFSDIGGTDMGFFLATDGADWSNPPFATLFLRKMLENDAYRQKFITRFADHLYITWNPRHIAKRVDYHANWIQHEMPFQIARWVGTTSSYGNAIPSFNFWNNEVLVLKNFGDQRNAHMWSNLNDQFALNGYSGLKTDVSSPQQGRIRLHDLYIPAYPWTGQYFQNRPFTLTAEANPGFKFVRWEKTVDSTFMLLSPNSVWKYYDGSSAPPSDWASPFFSDGSWASGPAELGYGDGDEATTLSFGSNASDKTPAYFFRQNFNISNPAVFSSLLLRMVVDDGAVAYLNGQEIWRFNMGTAPVIAFTDYATSTASDESGWHEAVIPANLLHAGSNTLAVEIHQVNGSSSDISFNASLAGVSSGQGAFLSANPVLVYSLGANPESLRAVFESDGTCGVLPDSIFQDMTLTAACSPYKAAGNVVLKKNAKLSVEPGVEIWMPEKANLWVEGELIVNGTQNARVIIKNAPGASHWGAILLQNTEKTAKLKYLTLEHATAGMNRIYFPAAISAYKANLEMDHLDLTQVDDNPIFARFSDVSLMNSLVKSKVTGDGINIKQGHGRVENCEFSGGFEVDMDAIDFDGVKDGIMRNNLIHDFRGDNNDGLDIGEQCQNLVIEGNFIYHCFDKGISVGQQSTANIRNNTIAYTAIGIALKDQSPVNIDHCTLFGNQEGIFAYEKNAGSLGGNGIVTNCIVSNAAFATYLADSLSSVTVSDCLSDPDQVQGNNVITADPQFENPTLYDFRLKTGSPASGSGQNGSDLGANPLPVYHGPGQLMFSEIFYDDTLSTTGEFLEFLNPGPDIINLEGYALVGSPDFVFPTGAQIAPGEFIVLAADASVFAGSSFQVFQWTAGRLANEGEKLLLYDKDGLLVDFVRYNNHAPWPEQADLMGRSIELRSRWLDNHFASSWQPGPQGGSPGGAPIESASFTPESVLALEIYPNPAGSLVNLLLPENISGAAEWVIKDLLGRVKTVQDVRERKISLDVSNWPQGVYGVFVKGKNGAVLAEGRLIR